MSGTVGTIDWRGELPIGFPPCPSGGACPAIAGLTLFSSLLISDGNGHFEAHPMARSAARLRPRSVRCPVCGTRFKVNSRGRPPTFCSQSCRQRANERQRGTLIPPWSVISSGRSTRSSACSRYYPLASSTKAEATRSPSASRRQVTSALLCRREIAQLAGGLCRNTDRNRSPWGGRPRSGGLFATCPAITSYLSGPSPGLHS
jgi:hypothetical protein